MIIGPGFQQEYEMRFVGSSTSKYGSRWEKNQRWERNRGSHKIRERGKGKWKMEDGRSSGA